MKFLIVLCLASVAIAVPTGFYGAPLAGIGPIGYAAPVAVASPAGLGGHGFGFGGHFSPVPQQTIQLVGVPQPYPVAQPIPVDQPYSVPVDKPYTVPIDRPVAAPYVAKVVQPVVHKQTVISSAIHSYAGHK